jgi:alkylated DNA nucleotide flippase Atl1
MSSRHRQPISDHTAPADTSSRDERRRQIIERVRAIPAGCVRTYGDVAPGAPRLVGRILATTHDLPWHRLVRADGTIPQGARQRELLLAEGVPMRGDRVDLANARVSSASGPTARSSPATAGPSSRATDQAPPHGYFVDLQLKGRPMSTPLPDVISRYFQLDAARDVDAIVGLFADDATVVDEGATRHGAAAIRNWRTGTASTYTYTTDVTGAEALSPDHYLVSGRLTGNFPGGTADLTWDFTIARERIKRLVIAP